MHETDFFAVASDYHRDDIDGWPCRSHRLYY